MKNYAYQGKCYRLSCQIRAILYIIRRTYQKIVIYHYCYLYYYNYYNHLPRTRLQGLQRLSPFNIGCFTSKYEYDTRDESLSSSKRGEKLKAPSHSFFTFLILMGRKTEPMTTPKLLFVESRERGPWWDGVRLCECIAAEGSICLK